MKSTRIDIPKTKEALALFLYAPIPGYALVCFDDDVTSKEPSSFRNVADDLGDERNRTDMKFLRCCIKANDEMDVFGEYNISSFLTYCFFRCGGDYKELGRMTTSRHIDHTKELRSFALRAKEDNSDKLQTTLWQKLLFEDTKATVDGFLAHLSTDDELKLDSKAQCAISTRGYTAVITIGKTGTCRIVAFIGEEESEGDPELLTEVLNWNFHEGFLCGTMIGLDRQSTRFTLEINLHIYEGGYNDITFANVVHNFGSAIDTCVSKIKEFREKQEEAKRPPPTRKLTKSELREERLHKFGGDEKAQNAKSQSISKEQPGGLYCWCCRRRFKSEGQMTNHKKSKKHKRAFKLAAWEESKSPLMDSPCEPQHPTVAPNYSDCPFKKEKQENQHHRQVLRDLIAIDKDERRRNGGKLKSKLGVDGYRPTGTYYEQDFHAD